MKRSEEKQPTVQTHHEYDVLIERFADQGRCIAHVDGRVVFVRFALPGETDRIRIDEPCDRNDRFWTGEVVTVLTPSPYRCAPVWPLAGPLAQGGGVGGADLIHVSLEGQHQWKKTVIDQQMEHLAGVSTDATMVFSPLDVPEHGLHWRTRIEMVADDQGYLSMRRRESHVRIPLDDMPLATSDVLHIAAKHHLWEGGFTPGTHVKIATPSHYTQHGDDNYAILIDGTVTYGKNTLIETVPQTPDKPPLIYLINAKSFWQVHRDAPHLLTSHIRSLITEQLQITPQTIWDLYSGSGLFTIFLASLLPESQLFSIEGAQEAVHYAEKNSKHLGMQNRITPACGDVLKTLSKVPSTLSTPDLIVLDPPRAGAKKEVCKKLIAAHPQAIIYIACDPTSLARDTKTLVAGGYHIQSLTGFDIYPMTHHVETVCLFVPSKERLYLSAL